MAQACQEDGCSVETVSNLLDQLKSKKKELEVNAGVVTVKREVTWPFPGSSSGSVPQCQVPGMYYRCKDPPDLWNWKQLPVPVQVRPICGRGVSLHVRYCAFSCTLDLRHLLPG